MKLKFKTAAALFALLFVCTSIDAFVPGYPRAVAPGDHHERIVIEALDEIYAGYGYGPKGAASYTNTMKSVINVISRANLSFSAKVTAKYGNYFEVKE
jgi:hypothetical protein